MSDKPCIFVHTNHRQYVGALVSQYSMRRNARDPGAFDVQILDARDHAFLRAREGQTFLRNGRRVCRFRAFPASQRQRLHLLRSTHRPWLRQMPRLFPLLTPPNLRPPSSRE